MREEKELNGPAQPTNSFLSFIQQLIPLISLIPSIIFMNFRNKLVGLYCYNIFLFPSAKQASLNERKIKLKVLFWLNEVRVVCWPPALAAPFHSTSLPPAKKNKVFFRGLPFRSIHSALLVWCWVCFHCCGALAALQPITHNNSINPNQTNCLLQRAARIQSN